MVRTLPLAAISVLVACAFVLAPAANAATATVQIRSTGFSPGALTIDKGDRVTWRNVDKVDHQVVADDGAFASPILRPNQSWTSTLGTAGTFRYHDALRPKLTAKVTVKGPPPSVALSLSAPIVYWGTPVTLSGTISSGAVNQSVQLYQQPFGQAAPTPLATVTTGANGAFSYALTPNLYTTYTAKWGNVTSGSVVVQVAPKMRLVAGLAVAPARDAPAALAVRAVGDRREPQARRAERPDVQARRLSAARPVGDSRVPGDQPGGHRPPRLPLGDAGRPDRKS